jgi:hemolysin D
MSAIEEAEEAALAAKSKRKAVRQSKRAPKPRPAAEPDFLPAALEVLETAPSPMGRAILWLILLAAAAAIAWACLAQLDVVAVSEGRVIPRARLQSVEAAEAGVVRAIHVREGERVRTGDPLIAFDPTFADADRESARVEYATALLARARAEVLIAFAAGERRAFTALEGADPAAAEAETLAVGARIAVLQERLAGVESRIAGAQAALEAARADRLSIEETLPLVEEQLAARRTLEERGFAARALVAQWEERAVTQRRALEARQADERRAQAEVAMVRRERTQHLEDFRAQAAAELAEAEAIVATRAQSVRRAVLREGFQVLNAPVDGVVNEIAVTTLGEVVEPGAPLVTIVPAGEELIVEALVLNRDVGFVRPGREVVVKLEAFPFTRHGYLEGVVEHVSADAIADEQRGLVFPARVRITASRLRDVGGASASQAIAAVLTPGMSAQVEVITGRRRVIEYLLSPIARTTREAGRER